MGHRGARFSLTLKRAEPPSSTSSSSGVAFTAEPAWCSLTWTGPGPLAGSVAVPGPHLEAVGLGARQAADRHAGRRPGRHLRRVVDVGPPFVVFHRAAGAGRVPFQRHVVAAHLGDAQVLRLPRQVRPAPPPWWRRRGRRRGRCPRRRPPPPGSSTGPPAAGRCAGRSWAWSGNCASASASLQWRPECSRCGSRSPGPRRMAGGSQVRSMRFLPSAAAFRFRGGPTSPAGTANTQPLSYVGAAHGAHRLQAVLPGLRRQRVGGVGVGVGSCAGSQG